MIQLTAFSGGTFLVPIAGPTVLCNNDPHEKGRSNQGKTHFDRCSDGKDAILGARIIDTVDNGNDKSECLNVKARRGFIMSDKRTSRQ